METVYRVMFEVESKRDRALVRDLVRAFPPLELEEDFETVLTVYGELARALRDRARQVGLECGMAISTRHSREEVLAADLGLLYAASSRGFTARVPKDGYSFASACSDCGLGAVQTKPLIMHGAVRGRAAFYYASADGTHIIIRTPIAREIIERTSQPGCFRHPVDRQGHVIADWMQAIPGATLPPISRETKGVTWHEGCPICGRRAWRVSHEEPVRLMYPRRAALAAQRHAVVSMYEPCGVFPNHRPGASGFDDELGLPRLLFNKAAVQVLERYIQPERFFPTHSSIEPVYSE